MGSVTIACYQETGLLIIKQRRFGTELKLQEFQISDSLFHILRGKPYLLEFLAK